MNALLAEMLAPSWPHWESKEKEQRDEPGSCSSGQSSSHF
jgi:hypothetical protein